MARRDALIRQGKLPAISDSADTYSLLINHLLPVGLKGIVAAALLAALMSSVSGAFNSISTLFSLDLYKRWRPNTPDRRLTQIGRLVTFIGMINGSPWSPLISHFQSIFQGIVALICYIAPPITAVLLGVTLATGLGGRCPGHPVHRVSTRPGRLLSRLVQKPDGMAHVHSFDDGHILSFRHLLRHLVVL